MSQTETKATTQGRPWSVLDTPMARVHQHLCAFHVVADDHGRQIQSHHYCTCVSPDFHQCIIYDSDKPTARLIGIEYLVSEKIFNDLPEEEKKYWHSHKYEVESGILVQLNKTETVGMVSDKEEENMMKALHKTFGKVIHTWNIDVHPTLPMGPPSLMMSYTSDSMVNWDQVKNQDASIGIDTATKKKSRASYLPLDYPKNKAADAWMVTGKAPQLALVEKDLKSGL